MAVHIEEPEINSKGRSHRLWWWAATTIACALAVPVATTGREADAAPQRPAAVCTGNVYTVVAGDGWYLIANKNRVSSSALLAANNATVATRLFPGMRLCLPVAGTTPTTIVTPSAPSTSIVAPSSVSIAQFPVQGACWFTDTFGAPRSGGRKHEGVDILAPSGQYIYAVAAGVLTKQYVDAPGTLAGNGWRLTRADGTYFFYAHLSAFAPGLTVGTSVAAGQIIGYVGKTGNAGAPHLHFEVHPGGGIAVNPTPIVKAVDGCKVTSVPAQPASAPAAPTTAPPTTAPPTTAPPTTAPPTTAPATTAPATTAPATTVLPTTGSMAAGTGARWALVAPTLLFDSQGVRLRPHNPVTVTVGGVGGVPADTTGAMVRLTARNAAGSGWVAVHDCAVGPNSTSALSIQPQRLNATTTLASVANGRFCVTSSVSVDLRVLVVGHHAAQGLGVTPVPPKRAVDTRSGSKLAGGKTLNIRPSQLGTPLGSKAITATVTLVAPDAAGAIGLGACGGSPWIVNYVGSVTQVFAVVLPTNDSGICVTSTAAVHLVVDVSGVWRGDAGGLAALPPTRVYDSRPGGVGPSTSFAAGVPPGATRAQYTVTVVAGATAGGIALWNCSGAQPPVEVASTPAGTVTSVTVTLDVTGGAVCVAASGGAHTVVDLVGVG